MVGCVFHLQPLPVKADMHFAADPGSQQAPIGVSIDETNKCRSCEFSDGCEWLESKAAEERQKAVAKRQQREAATQKK